MSSILQISLLWIRLNMIKKLLSLSLVFLSCCSLSLAQSDFSEFQIFKDDAIKKAYETNEYVPLMDISQAKQDLNQLTRSYDSLLESVNELDVRKKSLDKHYGSAQVAAKLTLQDMKETQQNLDTRRTQVSITLSKVQSLKKDLDVLSQDIAQSSKNISIYSRFLYKTINDYYISDQDLQDLSDIKILSKSENIARSLSKDELTKLLYRSLEQSFEYMQQNTAQYETMLQSMQANIAQYNFEIKSYQKEVKQLEQQRTHVDELLNFLQKDKAYIDQQIDKFTKSEKDLETQIQRMDKITKDTQEFLSKNKWVRDLLQEKDKSEWSTYFSRPVRIPNIWLDDLRKQLYPDASWIVLDVTQWDEVFAPAPWIVYKVFKSSDVWTSRVILLHKYGYSTVFMPLSSVLVDQGSIVKRWDIIWLTGGKPWTVWAWLESPRSHLYIEILKNSQAIDPYTTLDLSVFRSKDILDEQYYLKRKQDYLARNIDLSDIPTLKWETVEQRRDYFLSKSGNEIFGDPNLRLTAAQWTSIDPNFGICIWAAETSYKNFKSWNNIGNVWNNDRGDTVVYNSPVDWVRAIYKTLSNSYLWSYTMMNQLSRYGNKDSYIYASDPINRQKNIMRCLSMIYEINVPEDYFFRIHE